MKRSALILLFTMFSFFLIPTAFCFADDFNHWYLGAGYGYSETDAGITDLTGGATADENDSGWKIVGGYQINKYLGIELSYIDFGTARLSGDAGASAKINNVKVISPVTGGYAEADASTTSLTGVAYLPLDVTELNVINKMALFGKIGAHYWDVDYTIGALNTSRSLSDEDGIDISFGLGFCYSFDENLAFRVEAERFKMVEDVDYFSGGFIIRF